MYVSFRVSGLTHHCITFHSSITISGSTTISDFTEFATRLYFCAACNARRVRASITSLASPASRNADHRPEVQPGKISVRSNSISLVPSVRHS